MDGELGVLAAGRLTVHLIGPGTRVGALAGLFAALPIVAFYAVIVGSLLVGVSELIGVAVSVLLVSLLVAVVYLVALSAAGGYLSARLADRGDADATA